LARSVTAAARAKLRLPKIKAKEMKGNERKKSFFFFHFLFGIGTFQWVTTDSNKKTFLPSQSWSDALIAFVNDWAARRFRFREWKYP
jgi:hypothetical protein